MVDLLVYAVGYEARSRFVAEEVEATKRIALVFEQNHKFSFHENLSLAESRGDFLINEGLVEQRLAESVFKTIKELRDNSSASTSRICVGIDVSSMTRAMMSKALTCLLPFMEAKNLALRLFYAPAEYQDCTDRVIT